MIPTTCARPWITSTVEIRAKQILIIAPHCAEHLDTIWEVMCQTRLQV